LSETEMSARRMGRSVMVDSRLFQGLRPVILRGPAKQKGQIAARAQFFPRIAVTKSE